MVQINGVTDAERDEAAAGKPVRTPVPEGDYTATINEVKERALPDGTPEWSIQMEIQDGPSKTRWLFDTLTWNKDFRWKQILVLEACGFDLSKNCELLPHQLEGITVHVTVKHRTKGDKTYANISAWEPTPF